MGPIVTPFPDEETEAQREVTCPWHPAGNSRANRELLLYHSRRVGGPAAWVQGGPGPGLNPGSAPHLLVSPGKLLGLPRLTCPLCPMGKYSRIKAHSSCSCGKSWKKPHVSEWLSAWLKCGNYTGGTHKEKGHLTQFHPPGSLAKEETLPSGGESHQRRRLTCPEPHSMSMVELAFKLRLACSPLHISLCPKCPLRIHSAVQLPLSPACLLASLPHNSNSYNIHLLEPLAGANPFT